MPPRPTIVDPMAKGRICPNTRHDSAGNRNKGSDRTMKRTEARGIQSIDVSGRILGAMLQLPSPVMLKDIAAQTDIAAAQVHAYLSSFKRMDLVVQNAADGRYSLGALALRLGLAYRDSFLPMRAASETLEIVSARTGYTCALVIWTPRGPTVFEVRAGRETLNVNVRPGTVLSLTGSTVGAVFSALLPEDAIHPVREAERQLDGGNPSQWTTTTTEMAALMANARTHGFVALAGRPISGVNSISMPIFDPSGELVGTMLMLGHESRMDIASGGTLYDEVRTIMQDRAKEPRS